VDQKKVLAKQSHDFNLKSKKFRVSQTIILNKAWADVLRMSFQLYVAQAVSVYKADQ
jgi:hypothetical protein